jgi:hypothetical protein
MGDFFRKAEGLQLTEVADGAIVHDSEMKSIHHLNPVAALIFVLCEPALTAADIARLLAEEFGLEQPPFDDVATLLGELQSKGLVVAEPA